MPDEGRDFQRISLSRETQACTNGTDNEFAMDSPKKRSSCMPKPKRSGTGGLQNGTFRLKMIWFTGTGMVHANWETINGKSIA